MAQELKDGQEVTINVPFTYTIGDEGFRTDKVLKTVQDCKDEALAEIEAGVLNEPEVFMEVVISPYNVERKDEIEKIFIDQMAAFVQFIYEDVCETADPVNWTSEDVRIGFRRWIESQI
jgi:hypothetical protein